MAVATDAAPPVNDAESPGTTTVAAVAVTGPAGSTAPFANVISAAAVTGSTDLPSAEVTNCVFTSCHEPFDCSTNSGPAYASTVNDPSGFAHTR